MCSNILYKEHYTMVIISFKTAIIKKQTIRFIIISGSLFLYHITMLIWNLQQNQAHVPIFQILQLLQAFPSKVDINCSHDPIF